jgi:hypothetical protein
MRFVNVPNDIAFYKSSNGDRWYLLVDEMPVRHEPNRASGAEASTTSVDEFLSEGHGPQ